MSETQDNRSRATRVRLPLWAAALVFVGAALLLVGSGVWVFQTVRQMVAGNTVTQFDLSTIERQSTPSAPGSVTLREPQVIVSGGGGLATPVAAIATEEPMLDLSTFERWQGTERINILLLGIDSRCEDDGPTRTDSMILISIDPLSKAVSGLSMPRDLWVEIPGFGLDRINKAYYNGDLYEYPGGGAALSMETVENFLGVKVEHYVEVNFEGFRDFINLIDGIQVDVPEPINDPNYPDECYGYEGFRIDAGVQSMNGPIALKYARTRATANGDIDRAQRQQQVILAVRQKLLDVNMIPRMIGRAPQLWRTFQDNARTSFTEAEAIQLAILIQEIPRDNIRMGVIDYNYVYNELTPDNQQVLVPNYEAIRQLRQDLFRPIEPPPPVVENLPQLVDGEAARVAVYNGTPTFGLAALTQDYLRDRGIDVTEIGNAEQATYPTSYVIDYGAHPNTVLYLTQLMDLPPLNASSSADRPTDYDILVIIGNDWAIPASSE